MSKHNYIALAVIFVLGITFHFKYINEFPSHIHAWTQADRYALSLGFVNNKLNFFKPQTYVITNGGDTAQVQSALNESITAVDFPIHDYIPALIMKFSGVKSPWIFRAYILLYSFIGLFFLFRLSYLITADLFKSIFILLFAATSPVFIYYQGGFLPTIPSLANAIIGIYFFFVHLQKNEQKAFNLSILFFTLATLSRSTFVIPLLAVLGIITPIKRRYKIDN
jgi:hypothetical protein